MLGTDPDLEAVNLDQTIAALEAGVTTLAPETAVQILTMWYDTVLGESNGEGNLDLSDVAEGIGEVRDLLQHDALDTALLGDALIRLGESTFVVAQLADDERLTPQLEHLATLLSRGGNLLSGGLERSTADEPDGSRA